MVRTSHSRRGRQHLENIVGAFVTVYADRMGRALSDEIPAGGVVPAAVAALHTWPDVPIEFLAGVLGLTHSGTVRLVDRLEAEGLAVRRAGTDRRSVAVRLTPTGRALAARVRAARAVPLRHFVNALTQTEREVIGRALDRILRQAPRTRTQARHACRLCDHSVCRGETCPIGESVPARE
jgi:DNA-binding MarR family transcriptional regulator